MDRAGCGTTSRHGARCARHTPCPPEARLSGQHLGRGPVRYMDAQTPTFDVLAWQVWAGNQHLGAKLCVSRCCSREVSGEGCCEASARPAPASDPGVPLLPEMSPSGILSTRGPRGCLWLREAKRLVQKRTGLGASRLGLAPLGPWGAGLRWLRPLCPAQMQEAEPGPTAPGIMGPRGLGRQVERGRGVKGACGGGMRCSFK